MRHVLIAALVLLLASVATTARPDGNCDLSLEPYSSTDGSGGCRINANLTGWGQLNNQWYTYDCYVYGMVIYLDQYYYGSEVGGFSLYPPYERTGELKDWIDGIGWVGGVIINTEWNDSWFYQVTLHSRPAGAYYARVYYAGSVSVKDPNGNLVASDDVPTKTYWQPDYAHWDLIHPPYGWGWVFENQPP